MLNGEQTGDGRFSAHRSRSRRVFIYLYLGDFTTFTSAELAMKRNITITHGVDPSP